MSPRLASGLLAASLTLGGCGLVGGTSGGYEVTAYFERAVSLYESSEVRILGLPAGEVIEVKTEGERVRVRLRIDDDVPVPADATAAIVPQSLIGERYVQLLPAWTQGDERMADGATIPVSRTQVPVEPDEALEALKDFLDSLDPEGAGRLVTNAADALEGNGEGLGNALEGVSRLVATLAAKDEALVSIMSQLDEFNRTLLTRESQIGESLRLFAEVTDVLADERLQIEGLIAGLAEVTTKGLDVVSRNAATLQADVERVGRLLRIVDANLGAVEELLDSGPPFVEGIAEAYNPEFHRIDLRVNFSPVLTDAIGATGLVPTFCIPLDVECEAPASAPADADSPAATAGPTTSTTSASTSATTSAPASPIDDIVDLLASSSFLSDTAGGDDTRSTSRSGAVVRAASGVGGFLRDAASSLLGVGG